MKTRIHLISVLLLVLLGTDPFAESFFHATKDYRITFREAPVFRFRSSTTVYKKAITIDGFAYTNIEVGYVVDRDAYGLFYGPDILKNTSDDNSIRQVTTIKKPVFTNCIGLYYYRNFGGTKRGITTRLEAGGKIGNFYEHYTITPTDMVNSRDLRPDYDFKNWYYGGPLFRASVGLTWIQTTVGYGLLLGRRTIQKTEPLSNIVETDTDFAYVSDLDFGITVLLRL